MGIEFQVGAGVVAIDENGVLTAAGKRINAKTVIWTGGMIASSLTSCQHAIFMGRYAGHNVAADLVGAPTLEYRQPFYATCLDLGEWGAVYTEGWDRQVLLTHDEGKARKRMINTQWIYPPAANRADALATGNPL